jgi:UPF0716 protein FxsA
MAMRVFLVYVLVELAVLVALASTIGFGWTLLLLLGTFALGLALAGSQARQQLRKLQSGLASPQGVATDGLLVALGTMLTLVPGLVTSAAGLFLLLPPTRTVARPAVAALAARGIGRMPLIVNGSRVRAGRGDYIDGDYIDGEVIDVTDYEPPSLPRYSD